MTSPILTRDGAPPPGGIQVRLEPVVDRERLGDAWRALEPRSDASFFQSWSWIGCWLRHLPPDRQPLAAIASCGDQIVGLGVFLSHSERRHGLLPTRTLRLHETGESSVDRLFVEHNGLLADQAHAPSVWAAVLRLLTGRRGRDQVRLAGLAGPAVELCLEAARTQGRDVVVQHHTRSAHLDLAALRRSGRDLADELSRNTRHQLARARRLYEAIGPVTLRSAECVEEALAMLDRLKALHQTSWRRRGQPGCFAAPWFESFHRDLIRARFSSGEIQLLAAVAGDRPIGYLYNFAHGDRVYAYQSGFDDVADGRLKPGLVTHALAIEQAARAGFAVYDFMAGGESPEGQPCLPLDRDGLARRAGAVRGLLVGSPARGSEEADAESPNGASQPTGPRRAPLDRAGGRPPVCSGKSDCPLR